MCLKIERSFQDLPSLRTLAAGSSSSESDLLLLALLTLMREDVSDVIIETAAAEDDDVTDIVETGRLSNDEATNSVK